MTATQAFGTAPASNSICTIASKDSSAMSIRVPANFARSQSVSDIGSVRLNWSI